MSALDEMMRRCETFKISERRSNSPEYKELVFLNKDLDQWRSLLEEIFGPESKPVGKEPTAEDKKVTGAYGGIHSNQALFKKKEGDHIFIAMLWPWGDRQHTTLKLAVFK